MPFSPFNSHSTFFDLLSMWDLVNLPKVLVNRISLIAIGVFNYLFKEQLT